MAALAFTKMHGLGNDFVVVDATQQSIQLTPEQIRRLADRHFGIGCDQLLLVESSRQKNIDFGYRIFNADGSEVEQCGNGARCFAVFVHQHGLTNKNPVTVTTLSGVIELSLEDQGWVRVNMGVPKTQPAAIPFVGAASSNSYKVALAGEVVKLAVVNMGNPHAVLQVKDVDKAPVSRLGPLLQANPRFPQSVNVGFMQVLNPEHIRLRVYERGAGETLACGTGACAAVVAGRQAGLLAAQVRVQLPGGELKIEWQGEDQPVFMTGPAVTLYEGRWVLEAD